MSVCAAQMGEGLEGHQEGILPAQPHSLGGRNLLRSGRNGTGGSGRRDTVLVTVNMGDGAPRGASGGEAHCLDC